MAKLSTAQNEEIPVVYPTYPDVDVTPVETFSLDELAEKHGQKIKGIVPDCDPYKPDHMMASLLNGWVPHSHHHGIVMLSSDDYLACLEAAKAGNSYGPANKRPLK